MYADTQEFQSEIRRIRMALWDSVAFRIRVQLCNAIYRAEEEFFVTRFDKDVLALLVDLANGFEGETAGAFVRVNILAISPAPDPTTLLRGYTITLIRGPLEVSIDAAPSGPWMVRRPTYASLTDRGPTTSEEGDGQ